MDSGLQAKVNCPRLYLTDYLSDSRNYDLRAAEAAASAGLEFMLFDSEPEWLGTVCRCDACERAWQDFQKKRLIPFQTLTDVWKKKDPQSLKLLQQFWDEFHVTLWSVFRKKMDSAAPGKKYSSDYTGFPLITGKSWRETGDISSRSGKRASLILPIRRCTRYRWRNTVQCCGKPSAKCRQVFLHMSGPHAGTPLYLMNRARKTFYASCSCCI